MRGASREGRGWGGCREISEPSQWREKQHLLLAHWLAGRQADRQAGDLGQ